MFEKKVDKFLEILDNFLDIRGSKKKHIAVQEFFFRKSKFKSLKILRNLAEFGKAKKKSFWDHWDRCETW